MIQSVRIDSRSQALLETVEHTDVVSIGLWQVNGSRDEAGGELGFSHFLEHMLFKGTAKRNAFQIAQEVERVGGYLNAFTEKEITCFYCTLPADHLQLAVDVLTDMCFHSLLAGEEIEKEKAVVMNEIQTIEDNPEEKGHQLYIEGLWDGHELSRKITGESEQVRRITPDLLKSFYLSRFAPENTVVAASGRLEPSRLLEQLEEAFSGIPARQLACDRRPPARRSSWVIQPDKFKQVHLYTGISHESARQASEYYKELVFNTLFGESMSSRLFQRLREDKGLCYAIYSFRSYFTDAALWTIYASTAPRSLAALVDAVEEELARLHYEPPSEKEVQDAKSQIRGSMIMAKEDMENRMKRLFRQYHLTERVVDHDESLRLLSAVSREDILRLIAQRIRARDFNLLAYGAKGIGKLERDGFAF